MKECEVKRMRIRHNYDARFFKYNKTAKPLESGISFLLNKVLVADYYSEDCGFWIHEFTELAIIRILNNWGKNWKKFIGFKGFKPAKIAHFISPYGLNNSRCLEPQKSRKDPKW